MVAGNWKMNKSPTEARLFAGLLASEIGNETAVDVVVFPPVIDIPFVVDVLKDTNIGVGVQNAHPKEKGAFTGETSLPMVKDLNVRYVLVGHSERRHIFGESDEFINEKVKAVLSAGLAPVFCVGETLEEREKGLTKNVLERQVRLGLFGLDNEDVVKTIIAYEPVWAIGTGVVATPEQAEEAMAFIRSLVGELYDKETAEKVRILYGGSIKPENFDALIRLENVDGGLVGGASLKGSFVELVKIAKRYV